ncbi:MAG: DNRLRE domain-containing protein [Polyangiaceae bacterium]
MTPLATPATARASRKNAVARAVLAIALAGLSGAGCASGPRAAGETCTGAGACTTGVCVAGRCRDKKSPPTKASSARVVLVPRDLAILTSAGEDSSASTLPESIALGRKSTGRAVLLFRFVSTWSEDADIESAYFVIEPVEGAPAPETPPVVEIARILSPWEGATASWGRQPRLSLPESIGPLRVLSTAPIRLDVTPQVRAWSSRAQDDHGLAMLVDGSDPNGVLASTGVASGLGPHLEVYLR